MKLPTLTEALISASDRFEAIIGSAGDAAIVLSRYPELLEKEPVLEKLVEIATPRSHRINNGLDGNHKPRQRKPKTKQVE